MTAAHAYVLEVSDRQSAWRITMGQWIQMWFYMWYLWSDHSTGINNNHIKILNIYQSFHWCTHLLLPVIYSNIAAALNEYITETHHGELSDCDDTHGGCYRWSQAFVVSFFVFLICLYALRCTTRCLSGDSFFKSRERESRPPQQIDLGLGCNKDRIKHVCLLKLRTWAGQA